MTRRMTEKYAETLFREAFPKTKKIPEDVIQAAVWADGGTAAGYSETWEHAAEKDFKNYYGSFLPKEGSSNVARMRAYYGAKKKALKGQKSINEVFLCENTVNACVKNGILTVSDAKKALEDGSLEKISGIGTIGFQSIISAVNRFGDCRTMD